MKQNLGHSLPLCVGWLYKDTILSGNYGWKNARLFIKWTRSRFTSLTTVLTTAREKERERNGEVR
jgi:hypothetical protein